MRILLVKPPLNRNTLSTTLGEPLELEYIAASVMNQDVEIFDMRIEKKLIPKLERFKPDIVGITAYTCEANSARSVLKEVRRFNSCIKTVIGGHHATFLPGDYALPFVDTIFLGFSDFSFRKYVDLLEQGKDGTEVENIALVQNENLIFTEKKASDLNLDTLPWPARHLIRHYRKYYRDTSRRKTALLLTNRGCPFRCIFCACWKLMEGKYRIRNPESVVDEMVSLPDDIDLVCFADDNTLHSINRARRLVELLREKHNRKKFTMYARAETIVNHPDYFDFAHSIFPTKLSRKQFYREVANLYFKSYSLKRHLFLRFKNLRFLFKKPKGYIRSNYDRLSLFTVLLITIFALPKYLRLRYSYKSEPLITKEERRLIHR